MKYSVTKFMWKFYSVSFGIFKIKIKPLIVTLFKNFVVTLRTYFFYYFRAKEKGITILNEVGLDPGIDHLLAMECFDEVHQAGGKVESFISYCGGKIQSSNL